MKWILATVILLNIVVYWRSVQVASDAAGARSVSLSASGGSTLILHEELVDAEVLAPGGADVRALSPTSSRQLLPAPSAKLPTLTPQPVAVKLVCLRIGPMPDLEGARGIADQLTQLNISVVIENHEEVLSQNHWVYIPPLDSNEALKNMTRRLKEDGIESFVFHEGELKRGISLGFFNLEVNAANRRRDLAVKGYETEIQTIANKLSSFWLVISESEGRRLSNRFWRDMQRFETEIASEKIDCGRQLNQLGENLSVPAS